VKKRDPVKTEQASTITDPVALYESLSETWLDRHFAHDEVPYAMLSAPLFGLDDPDLSKLLHLAQTRLNRELFELAQAKTILDVISREVDYRDSKRKEGMLCQD
jgi:hypothetical protein